MTRYNQDSVQQAIDADPRIGKGEAKLIHAMLKGRHEEPRTYSELTQAVIAQLNLKVGLLWPPSHQADDEHADSTMRDIVNNGADGGYHGFTYYRDTCAFYDANEDAIWTAICDDADGFGQTPMQMIAGFAIADQITDGDTFKNALAWYALERAANEWTSSD